MADKKDGEESEVNSEATSDNPVDTEVVEDAIESAEEGEVASDASDELADDLKSEFEVKLDDTEIEEDENDTEDLMVDGSAAADTDETDDTKTSEDVSDTTLDGLSDVGSVESAGTQTQDAPKPDPFAEVSPASPTKQGSFGGMFTGGLVAAILGAAVVYFAVSQGWIGSSLDTTELEATIDAQAAEIAELKASITAITETNVTQGTDIEGLKTLDLEPLETAIARLAAIDADTSKTIETLTKSLTDTQQRLGSLEVQPIPEAVLPEEATKAYEKQLADILATIETRFSDMQSEQSKAVVALGDKVTAELNKLAAAQAEASASEKAALVAANTAAARTASVEIVAALESGAAFGDALVVLEEKVGIAAPDALATVSEGVTTMGTLIGQFPPLARSALAAAPRSPTDDGGSALTSILMSQLGARSLEPREGTSADAVLSRAEAALNNSDLDTTLTELEGLPDVAAPIFSDWVAQATALRDAKAAVAEVVTQLDSQ